MMKTIDPTSCRLETLLAALLYLMTVYQRRCCPRVASVIAAHLDCLAHHPESAEAVRRVASGMSNVWRRANNLPHDVLMNATQSVH